MAVGTTLSLTLRYTVASGSGTCKVKGSSGESFLFFLCEYLRGWDGVKGGISLGLGLWLGFMNV